MILIKDHGFFEHILRRNLTKMKVFNFIIIPVKLREHIQKLYINIPVIFVITM